MTLPRQPAAVVFDMDGLIFDTETLYQEAFLTAAIAGGHALPAEVIQGTIGVPWVRSRVLLLERMGSGFPVDQYFAEVSRHFELLAATQLRLKPGVVELLDHLDQLDMPRCIATSSPSPDPFLTAAKRLGVDPGLLAT